MLKGLMISIYAVNPGQAHWFRATHTQNGIIVGEGKVAKIIEFAMTMLN